MISSSSSVHFPSSSFITRSVFLRSSGAAMVSWYHNRPKPSRVQRCRTRSTHTPARRPVAIATVLTEPSLGFFAGPNGGVGAGGASGASTTRVAQRSTLGWAGGAVKRTRRPLLSWLSIVPTTASSETFTLNPPESGSSSRYPHAAASRQSATCIVPNASSSVSTTVTGLSTSTGSREPSMLGQIPGENSPSSAPSIVTAAAAWTETAWTKTGARAVVTTPVFVTSGCLACPASAASGCVDWHPHVGGSCCGIFGTGSEDGPTDADGASPPSSPSGPESGGPSMTVFLQQQCSDTRWLTVNSGLGFG
eukprot:m.325006 g.325006  ORF g.325006 m.325006 type:complete len:307 (+) comp27639_c3_seq1:1358-2278(+)